MDVIWTYCGDHFPIYKNTDSSCCIPEPNIMFYINYTSIKNFIKKMINS